MGDVFWWLLLGLGTGWLVSAMVVVGLIGWSLAEQRAARRFWGEQ